MIKSFQKLPYLAINWNKKPQSGNTFTFFQVGHALEHSLKLDRNGACYIVYPDCPIFCAPNATPGCFKAMIAVGQHIAGPLGIEDFTFKHVIALVLVMIMLFYFLMRIIIF